MLQFSFLVKAILVKKGGHIHSQEFTYIIEMCYIGSNLVYLLDR